MVSERRVRGALERTYILRAAAARIGVDELEKMSVDDHRQAFIAFVAGLLGDFDRYLARGNIDPLRDGVSYNLAGMWLDDAELTELLRDIARVFGPRLANPPKPGRKRRILGSVLLPGDEAPPADGSGDARSGRRVMRNLIYSMGPSLDGFIAGPGGDIDWSAPDEELHRFHNEQTRELGVHLCGRRLYETMVYWETADQDPAAGDSYGRVRADLAGAAEDRVLEDARARRGQRDARAGRRSPRWRRG